jgi:hypothetical protein
MTHKSFGWVAVFGCILSVGLAIFGSRETQPRSAEASTAWAGSTLACNSVIAQLEQIRQSVCNQRTNGQVTQMAAIDDLVSRQSEIDTVQCPAEFRAAEARYMAAANTLAVDAHIDFGANGEAAYRALFHMDWRQFPPDLIRNAPKEIKADLEAAHVATDNFQQVAAQFCGK